MDRSSFEGGSGGVNGVDDEAAMASRPSPTREDGEGSSQRSDDEAAERRRPATLDSVASAREEPGDGPPASLSSVLAPPTEMWCETEEEADAYLLRKASLL